jgi:hypothetical protein
MMRAPELCALPHRICCWSLSLSIYRRTARRSSSANRIKPSVIEALSGTIRDTLPKQSGTQRGIADSDVGKQIIAIYNLPKRFDDAGIGVVLLWDLGTRAPCARDSNNRAWPFSGEPLRKAVFILVGSSGDKLSIWSLQ